MSRVLHALASVCVACAVGGCAQSAEERQLAKMQEEIDSVEQAPRIEDETNGSSPRAPASQRGARLDPSSEAMDVQTFNEAAGMSEAADDTSARPVLRVTGASRHGGKEVVEQTMPDESAAPPAPSSRPSALDPDARKAYDSALALVNGKQYAPALEAFSAFLARYPDHPYASNAIYWRGECYFAQGDYLRAAEQFDSVVTRYPLGNKTPDALLKLGMTQQKLGNLQKAKEYFDKLQHDFPRSDAVRRIPTQGGNEAARPKGAGPQENP